MLAFLYKMKGYKMRKIISHLKKHKKAYLFGTVGVVAIMGTALFLSWNYIQFKHYRTEKEVCFCAEYRLSKSEKKAFVAMAKYMKKMGRAELDAGVLKYITADELTEVGLKIKSCTADVARQKMLDNNATNRKNFPGDYNCMRKALMNELSNEEVLFLQSPQSKSLEALKVPAVQDMYLNSSAKIMKCMNEEVQRQYLDEVEKIKGASPKKKVRKVLPES